MTQETNIGKVIQVIGPVVDIEFPSGDLPKIYNAVRIRRQSSCSSDTERPIDLLVEVMQQIGENRVRTVAMASTDGLVRGMKAIRYRRTYHCSCRGRCIRKGL